MIPKVLIINGAIFQYQQRYFKEDELWECAFVDANGTYAEVESGNLIAYDESLCQAKKELEITINENGLKPDIDNELVLWRKLEPEEQRKIMVLAKKIKWDLMSEWSNNDARFEKWRNMINARTGFVFPRTLFNRL